MTYIALTIGPIYKTLNSAKKTRDLWGGSYLFSYVMKKIIEEFDAKKFVVPYTGSEIFEKHQGVGLFHDRFIFKSDKGDKELLEKAVDKVVSTLAKNMDNLDEEFLKNYLQISCVEKRVEEGENIILKLTPYLNAKELFFKLSQYDQNLLLEKLQNNNSFLKKEAFGNNRGFPTLPEIALHDVFKDDEKMKKFILSKIKDDDEFSVYEDNEVKEKKIVKRYHKYIAIVHADGDNMGQVVQNLTTQTEFKQFSKKLFNYCSTSHKLIKAYGGETIFAGGDDLLFFAPVVNENESIFNLIDEISKEFDELFKDENQNIKDKEKQATLSFGLSITYHKFPLYEALEKSRDLLGDAKSIGTKNNIAFTTIKHSGQSFGGVFPKNNKKLYEQFLALTSNISGKEGADNFLHSLHHKIYSYRVVFKRVASSEQKLKNFFDNYFNEQEHKQYKLFFEALIQFINGVYNDKSIDKKLELVYATLRFVKFIKGDKS